MEYKHQFLRKLKKQKTNCNWTQYYITLHLVAQNFDVAVVKKLVINIWNDRQKKNHVSIPFFLKRLNIVS